MTRNLFLCIWLYLSNATLPVPAPVLKIWWQTRQQTIPIMKCVDPLLCDGTTRFKFLQYIIPTAGWEEIKEIDDPKLQKAIIRAIITIQILWDMNLVNCTQLSDSGSNHPNPDLMHAALTFAMRIPKCGPYVWSALQIIANNEQIEKPMTDFLVIMGGVASASNKNWFNIISR